jgi:adenylate kinase
VASGSDRGKKLNKIMAKGGLVPNKVVLDMIKEAMLAHKDTAKGFLIDGYPRQVDQGIEFEKEIVPCEKVLYCEASDDTMKARLLERGKSSGRVDDNEDSIKQRLETFHQVTQPVIDYYNKKGKLVKVNSEKSPQEVFEEVQTKLFDKKEEAPVESNKFFNFIK